VNTIRHSDLGALLNPARRADDDAVLGTHRLDNGYEVSVIDWGYGAPGAPYEVAIYGPDGHMHGDDVRGWQTAADVLALIEDTKRL
jgi:hypothetical protein